MSKEKKRQAGVLGLIVALIVVLLGGLLFVGAVSGWFDDDKVVLNAEYLNIKHDDGSFYGQLEAEGYESLVRSRKSFVVFVDQNGCTTADRLREYVIKYMEDTDIGVYRMMFSEVKESSLKEFVKYYPSVVLVDNGVPRWYLKADSDDDAEKYNNYEIFKEWIDQYLQLV